MKIVLIIVVLVSTVRGWSQEKPTFTSKVNVVSVLATVHDHDGRVIKNLRQDDFLLLEDGKPQAIRYFSRESDLPLTVGLLVDTSRSQTGVLDQERRASYAFLNQVLRPDQDRAFVVEFDKHVETLQGITSSRSELMNALSQLSIPGEYATLIHTAIRDSSENLMKAQSGRKAFALLTDGVAFKDPLSLETAIEFAQRADTIIYPIRFADHIKAYRPVRAAILAAASERGKEGLHRMAEETGGISYEVSNKQSIEAIYAQIEEDLRNQYSIGYTPGRPHLDGKYHKIQLRTKDHHLIVYSRKGYYAK